MRALHPTQYVKDYRGRLDLEPQDVSRLALLFFPSGVLLCIGRLVEFTGIGGKANLGYVLWTNLPVPAVLLACAVVTWLVVRQAKTPYAAFLAVAAALTVGVGGGVALRMILPWWLTSWLDLRAVGFLKTDMLLLLSVAAIIAFVLAAVGRGRLGRTAAWSLAHGSAAGIATVIVADLAALLGTGAHGGYFALRDFLLDPVHLMPVVMSEMTPGGAVLLLLPLAIGLMPLWAVRWAHLGTSGLRAIPLYHVMLVCVPLLGVTAAAPIKEGDPYAQGSIMRMATMTWDDLRWEGDGMEGMLLGANPFDLRDTRLVTTDSTRKLNVVVVVLESVRRTAVTPYAPDLPTTPFLDSLARHSLLVEEMFTPVPYTNKSLVSIFGGIPPSTDSRLVEALPGGIPSPGLPGLLRGHGYRTAFFTPATLAFERKDQILHNLGFEEAYGDGDFERAGFEEKAYFGFEDRIILDETLRWVGERTRREEPFFLGMLTLSAHHPYDVPADAVRLGLEPGNEDLNDYYDAVRYTDDFLRDLWSGFEEHGILDSTVFVIVGDHGEAFGEHGQTTHGNILWEEALQIPGLVNAPGMTSGGGRVSGPRLLTDVMPTVAEALHMEWAGPLPPGRSLLSSASPERTLVHAYKEGRVALALRRGAKKYFFEYRRRPTRVFNLEADAGERHDIVAQVDPGEIQSAERELLGWAKAVQQAYWLAREEAGVDGKEAPPTGLRRDLERRALPTVGP